MQNLPAGLLFLIFFSDSAAFHGCLRRMRCFPSINNRFRWGTMTRRRWKAWAMIVLMNVNGVGLWFRIWEFKTSDGCTSKKGMRPLLTNKFAGGDPHTFLKSAHALFEHPKSFTLSLPSSTPCFHRHLKQIAAPAGTCYLRKHPASSEPAGKALNVGCRKEKKKYYAGKVLCES